MVAPQCKRMVDSILLKVESMEINRWHIEMSHGEGIDTYWVACATVERNDGNEGKQGLSDFYEKI